MCRLQSRKQNNGSAEKLLVRAAPAGRVQVRCVESIHYRSTLLLVKATDCFSASSCSLKTRGQLWRTRSYDPCKAPSGFAGSWHQAEEGVVGSEVEQACNPLLLFVLQRYCCLVILYCWQWPALQACMAHSHRKFADCIIDA